MRLEKKDCVHNQNNVCDLLKSNECAKCKFYKTEKLHPIDEIERQILEYKKRKEAKR